MLMNMIFMMLNKYMLILFMLMFLFMFTISNDLYIQFMLMEFSSLFLIIFMNLTLKNKFPSIIYFMISILSTFLLMLSFFFESNNEFMLNKLIEWILYLKMGMFPFHIWNLYLYDKLNWDHIFMISVYSKFFIINFLNFIVNIDLYSIFYLIMNSIMICLISYKQISLKKLIGCSTTNQTSLFILLIYMNKNMFIMYFLLYMFISLFIYMYMYKLNINNKKDLIFLMNFKKMFLIMFIIYVCLPPITSFMMKWILFSVLINMNHMNLMLLLMILMMANIMMIWNYFSLLILPFLSFNMMKIKKIIFNKMNLIIFIYIFYLLFLIYIMIIMY